MGERKKRCEIYEEKDGSLVYVCTKIARNGDAARYRVSENLNKVTKQLTAIEREEVRVNYG